MPTSASQPPTVRRYRYFEFVMVAFVTVLVCSNLIGPAKIAQVDLPLIGAVTFGAGVLFFPISYVFGDILTEVYGYARARRVIWAGFAALAFASFMAAVVVALPPAPFWQQPEGLRDRLRQHLAHRAGLDVRLLLRRVRQLVRAGQDEDRDRGQLPGRALVGSTIAGEAVDSALFYPLAFYNTGIMPERAGAHAGLQPVHHQDAGGGRVPAGHLPRRGVPEARRARGPLRPRHRLQSVQDRELT